MFESLSQIRVLAYDDIYPEQSATATIDIQMQRNENRPQWTNETPLRVTIRETEPLGYIISSEPNATDADGVNVRCNWIINTLQLKQNRAHFTDDVFTFIFMKENGSIFIEDLIDNASSLVHTKSWGQIDNKPLFKQILS